MSSATALTPARSRSLAVKLVASIILLAATGAACLVFKPAAGVTEAGVVMHWPDKVLDFTGKHEEPSEAELELLPPDTQFAKKSYSDGKGDYLSAQIVLSGVEHRSIHRPEICLKGQGWNVRGGHIVKVPLKSGRNLDVMVLDITRPVRRANGETAQLPALYAYFFVSKDAETPKHLDRIAITNLDLLFHNKAHRWAYVIAMAQVLEGFTPGGKNREQTLEMLKDFLRETAPQFLQSEMPAAVAAKS